MIAHDMRTPLSALRLSIQAARTSAADPEALTHFLEIAEKNAKAVSNIVEALIDTSTDGKGVLVFSECLPRDLVTSAIDQIMPMAEGKRQSIIAEEMVALPPITADGIRIIRVLVNLLSNAVRFAHECGHIRVAARKRVNDGHECIVFSVCDDGPGVATGHVERIFLEGVSISNEGKYSSGLGLAVCKELVEAHRGRIWVEPVEKGATFSFSIPTTPQARD
ncbi:hypothetical protein BH09VER1_BH09VER1_22630 [soil metagenome]